MGSIWPSFGSSCSGCHKDQSAYNGQKKWKDMVSNLKDNDSIWFSFCRWESCERWSQNGDYYKIVTLPEDLSKKASSILTNHRNRWPLITKRPVVIVLSQGKWATLRWQKMKQSVAEKVTNTYTTALFSKMGSLKTGMGTAADEVLN